VVPPFCLVREAGMLVSALIPRPPSPSSRDTRSGAAASPSSCIGGASRRHECPGEVRRILPFLLEGRLQRPRPAPARGTSDARVRDHQVDRGTLPRVLQSECRPNLSAVEVPPP